jgi:hypothetical protein
VAPLPPAGADPATVAAWWSGLGSADRQALVTADPGLVGGLDGLPAWARDAANRTLLARTLAAPRDGGEARTAAAVAARLAEVERTGTVAQLQQFDPAQGLVALSVGDLDTADAVDVLVPGMNTTVDDDLGGWVTDAERVGAAARAAAPGLSVAGLVWFGYRTPTLLTVARRGPAERAAPVLDRALDGLAATRAGRPARVTVVAHSYGTLALGLAARQPGRLAADAVVLLGSPGVAVADASGLEAPEVHVAAAPADPVPHLADARVLGREPDEPGFGAAELPTDGAMGHSDYLDPGHPTLAAVGAVVAGRAPR